MPPKVSDDLVWIPIKPVLGALRSWVLKRRDGRAVELEDFGTV